MTDTPITDCVDEIDSFNSFYSNVYRDPTTLIIPYINLGLSDHPLNPGNRLMFLDFAYMLFLGVHYLAVQSGRLVGVEEYKGDLHYFGGYQLDSNPELIDFKIGCETAYLQPLSTSRLGHLHWVPVDSPKRNLPAETVHTFFSGEMMPDNIRKLVGQQE